MKASILEGAFVPPITSPVNLPKCEGIMQTEASARGRDKYLKDKCGRKAKVQIDGKKYCLRHAQQKALLILLKADQP